MFPFNIRVVSRNYNNLNLIGAFIWKISAMNRWKGNSCASGADSSEIKLHILLKRFWQQKSNAGARKPEIVIRGEPKVEGRTLAHTPSFECNSGGAMRHFKIHRCRIGRPISFNAFPRRPDKLIRRPVGPIPAPLDVLHAYPHARPRHISRSVAFIRAVSYYKASKVSDARSVARIDDPVLKLDTLIIYQSKLSLERTKTSSDYLVWKNRNIQFYWRRFI